MHAYSTFLFQSLKTAAVSVLLMFIVVGPSSASPTLIVQDGILMGAKGVDVAGSLYDIAFRDGTCIAVFGGCGLDATFTFQTNGEAIAAAWALLDQVIGVKYTAPVSFYQEHADRINGCAPSPGTTQVECSILTPWTVYSNPYNYPDSLWVLFTQANAWGFVEDAGDAPITLDFGPPANINTWAVWSLAAAAVPEPGGMPELAALSIGVAALAWLRRRGFAQS